MYFCLAKKNSIILPCYKNYTKEFVEKIYYKKIQSVIRKYFKFIVQIPIKKKTNSNMLINKEYNIVANNFSEKKELDLDIEYGYYYEYFTQTTYYSEGYYEGYFILSNKMIYIKQKGGIQYKIVLITKDNINYQDINLDESQIEFYLENCEGIIDLRTKYYCSYSIDNLMENITKTTYKIYGNDIFIYFNSDLIYNISMNKMAESDLINITKLITPKYAEVKSDDERCLINLNSHTGIVKYNKRWFYYNFEKQYYTISTKMYVFTDKSYDSNIMEKRNIITIPYYNGYFIPNYLPYYHSYINQLDDSYEFVECKTNYKYEIAKLFNLSTYTIHRVESDYQNSSPFSIQKHEVIITILFILIIFI